MEGPRRSVVIGAVIAGLAVGGTATAQIPDPGGLVTTLTTVISGVTTTVTGVTDVTTDVSLPVTTTDVSLPTTTDVPTVTVPTPTTPIDDTQPLPDLPGGGGLPPVVEGTVDATSQIVTTTGPDGNPPPLPGFTPTLPDVSPFGSVPDASQQAGPQVLRLITPEAPVAGQPVSFTLAAADDDAPISGVSFDFGETGARFGEAACRFSKGLSRRATFSVPYTFARSGPHVVRFELASGTCDSASRLTSGQVTVNVGQGSATIRAITGPLAGVLTHDCPNSDVLPTSRNRTRVSKATLCLLNSVRRTARLHALSSLRPLRRIAAQHSRDMVVRHYFDHTEPPGRTFVARLRTIHWNKSAGENIGYGTAYYATARAMMWAWMHSSGHRANILEPRYRYVGIAISIGAPTTSSRLAGTYTTDFGA